jgi:hypothetical protein|mmetsp:Transcript_1933/g.4256  ORF Transcript_1933/g.4256 Transcript_1933/m.4256 type:complete len:168 (+) Transcript_1933:196-699(+)
MESIDNMPTLDVPDSRPRRPMTSYTIFCRLERFRIVQTSQVKSHSKACVDLPERVDLTSMLRPAKYRTLILPENWYAVGAVKKKRKSHKIHGVISFSELSKVMSDNWATVDAETKQYCQGLADEEKRRYEERLASFIATYGEEAAKVPRKKRRAKKATTSHDGVEEN